MDDLIKMQSTSFTNEGLNDRAKMIPEAASFSQMFKRKEKKNPDFITKINFGA